MAEPLNVRRREYWMHYPYGSGEPQAHTALRRLLNDPQLMKVVQRVARQEIRRGRGVEEHSVAPHRLGRTARTKRAAHNFFICQSIIDLASFRSITQRHSRVRRLDASTATNSTERR